MPVRCVSHPPKRSIRKRQMYTHVCDVCEYCAACVTISLLSCIALARFDSKRSIFAVIILWICFKSSSNNSCDFALVSSPQMNSGLQQFQKSIAKIEIWLWRKPKHHRIISCLQILIHFLGGFILAFKSSFHVQHVYTDWNALKCAVQWLCCCQKK